MQLYSGIRRQIYFNSCGIHMYITSNTAGYGETFEGENFYGLVVSEDFIEKTFPQHYTNHTGGCDTPKILWRKFYRVVLQPRNSVKVSPSKFPAIQ